SDAARAQAVRALSWPRWSLAAREPARPRRRGAAMPVRASATTSPRRNNRPSRRERRPSSVAAVGVAEDADAAVRVEHVARRAAGDADVLDPRHVAEVAVRAVRALMTHAGHAVREVVGPLVLAAHVRERR